jgi:hypothetical protein
MKYRVFHRTWWTVNPAWPDGREPGAGKKYDIGFAGSEKLARSMCARYNATHEPGPLSDKAEYETC